MKISEQREELKRNICQLEKLGRRDDAMILLGQLCEIDEELRHSELVEQVRMGWGNTPGTEIPPDWRERPGPAISHFRKW